MLTTLKIIIHLFSIFLIIFTRKFQKSFHQLINTYILYYLLQTITKKIINLSKVKDACEQAAEKLKPEL